MLNKTISNKNIIIYIFFILLHIFLFNINFAEWGDSYRILRASEYIREGSYPKDEKRAPLYSILLAIRPDNIDQVTWGRLEMFVLSTIFFFLFHKYIKLFNFNEKVEKLSLWLVALNPIFLYWSIRIMADVPFALIVLAILYLHKKWEDNLNVWKLSSLGLLLGLGVLTRFEGYILGLCLGLAIVYKYFNKEEPRKEKIINLTKNLFTIFISFLLITLPWYILRNPFNSSYFEEPGGRVYNFNTFYTYIVSSMYMFGFSSACYFFIKQFDKAKKFFINNIFLTCFIIIELILALVWPAAIPRLFTPIIALLIVPLSYLIVEEFDNNEIKSLKDIVILSSLFLFYVVSQYILKLQFLVLIKTHLFIVIGIQLLIVLSILLNRYKVFKTSLIIGMLVWSFSTIYLHKDIFKAVVIANKYVVNNIRGKIAYNDVSSVSDWYLNQKSDKDNVYGVYLNMDSREGRAYEILNQEDIDYIMITNEHNTDMEFSGDEVDYLEEIEEFRYTIRGKEFFTKVLKVISYE